MALSTTAQAILRVCAYHHQGFDMAVIWFDTCEHNAVQTSLLSTVRDSATSLGVLENLPLELVNAICLELDVSSLFTFRHVSRQARKIIDSLPQYRIAITYSLDCFCAVLRTKAARFITLSEYYGRLCERMCSICGVRYGNLIHLLNWKRCCSMCLKNDDPQVRVTTRSAARRVLRSRALRTIPILKTLPGVYTADGRVYKRQYTVMTLDSALFASSRSMIGNTEALEEHRFPANKVLAFAACCAFPSYNPNTARVQHGVSCAGCQLALEIDVNMVHNHVRLRDSVYSEGLYLQHFATCEQAQFLWESSQHGDIEPKELPSACKNGGYFPPRD
nr:hypothetical protein CFP56_76162 [Quercus suber]